MNNTIKKQYQKERRRIQAFIRAAKKRGYIIPENILPKIPKRITQASVKRLKKLTPATIYGKSSYVSRETGEVLTGKQGRVIERRSSAKKAQVTRARKAAQTAKYSPPREIDNILQNILRLLDEFVPSAKYNPYMRQQMENNRSMASGILMDAIDELGEEQVARNIANSQRISDLLNEILYASAQDRVKFSLVEFAQIVRGESLSVDENISLSEAQETI